MAETGITVTGEVLAGGRARRMGGGDKGLIEFARKPLVTYALSALNSVTDHILINANRNQDIYASFGYPVVADHTGDFDGPLAGVLSGLEYCSTEYLLTVPCDCPLVSGQSLTRMIEAANNTEADCFVASDGDRLHPVFLLLDCNLVGSLKEYMNSGQRKIDTWLNQHNLCEVDFSDQPEIFRNVNTPDDLAALEAEHVKL